MRLSREDIYQIIVAHNQGEKRSVIAERFSVDNATVTYHIEQFERKYGSTRAVYSLVQPPKKVCCHPSLKCLVCGRAQDNIRREELDKINHLTRALAVANNRLETLGYEAIEPGTV